jgi:hypothetical protein
VLHRPVESTAESSHSGAIISASVILMSSSFLSMASRAPRTLSATSAALLDPVRMLQDGGFEGELVFVDLE